MRFVTSLNILYYFKHQFVPVDRILEIYFVGCHNNCKGCHNCQLQDRNFKSTRIITPTEILMEVIVYKNIAKQVHILGGEPLEQPTQSIIEFTDLLKSSGFKNITLFTGSKIEESDITRSNPIFRNVDYVKIGRYDETQLNTKKIKDKYLGITLASLNQKVITLHK